MAQLQPPRPLALSGLLRVNLAPDGSLARGRVVSLRLHGAGIPKVDHSEESERLVRRLSRQDFGSASPWPRHARGAFAPHSPCTTFPAAPSSRIRYAEIAISGSEISRITAATAFTSGSDWVWRSEPSTHSGSVVVSAPARKNVTAISSKDSANASSAPATSAVRIVGNVT